MYCNKCGSQMQPGSAFCPSCGQPAGASAPAGRAPGAASPASAVRFSSFGLPYAGFWLRLVAYLIDSVVLGVVLLAVIVFLAAATGVGSALSHMGRVRNPEQIFAPFILGFVAMILGVCFVGGWLYYALMESSSWQATLGKRAIDLGVTDLAGRRVTFARASGRYFARIITNLVPFWIGYILAGFTQKKQALHDIIAGCLVIRRA